MSASRVPRCQTVRSQVPTEIIDGDVGHRAAVGERRERIVWVAGDDWSHARARTPNAGQSLIDQFLDTRVDDTAWTQATTSPVPAAGTTLDVGDTAPTGDRWDLEVVGALGLDASVSAPLAHITRACQALAPTRGSMVKPLRVLIAGVPNVGKSTLINTLTARRAAKTGDEAGVTRLTQRIVLADGFYLFDTPGVLWPRIAVPQSGYNLAASGAIGKNAYEEIDVALAVLGYLKNHYAGLLQARYALAGEAYRDEAAIVALADEDLLEAIGRKRAALQSGNRVNLQKAADIVLIDAPDGGTQQTALAAIKHGDIAAIGVPAKVCPVTALRVCEKRQCTSGQHAAAGRHRNIATGRAAATAVAGGACARSVWHCRVYEQHQPGCVDQREVHECSITRYAPEQERREAGNRANVPWHAGW